MKNTPIAEIIQSCLVKSVVGVLGTYDSQENLAKLRVMYYGIDQDFNIFLISTRTSPKVKQMLDSKKVSFMVYQVEDPYDQSWQIDIEGRVEVLSGSKQIKSAMLKLKGRNPFADVALESNIPDQFICVRIIPDVIKYAVYGEILTGAPPKIFKL